MFLYGYRGYGFGFYYDPTYIFIIIAFILTAIASMRVRTVYGKYSKVRAVSGYSGAEAATIFLRNNGMNHIRLADHPGVLSDHFDPKNNIVRLSSENYNGHSISAVAVAAHECGHVMQYKENYAPIKVRAALVPVVNFSATLAWPIFFIGIFLSSFRVLIPVGILLFSFAVLFHIVTLPVELNASSRGMRLLRENNILQANEMKEARKVLNAAALTYVAAAMGSLLQLIRLILIARSFSDRD